MQPRRLLIIHFKIKTMAKKRKKATGRRRVGASKLNAGNPIVKYGSIALGYFMGDKINSQIDKLTGDKIDGKIVGGVQAGAGAFLTFGKGKKSMIKTVAGGVLLGSGAKKLMSEFGIGGIGPYGRIPAVAGAYGRVPVVAGKRRMGYTPNEQLGAYNPHGGLNGKMKVMAGVSPGSGSGILNDSPGSDMMN